MKKYMKDLLDQQRGLFTALDLAMVADEMPQRTRTVEGLEEEGAKGERGIGSKGGDPELAAALWRNLFGAAWGQGMGGVSGVFATIAEPGSEVTKEKGGETTLPEEQVGTAPKTATTTDAPILAEDLTGQTPSSASTPTSDFEQNAKFAENLERLVRYVRREMARLDGVSDGEIRTGEKGEAVGFGRM